VNLETIIDGIYKYADMNVYGLTFCSPLGDDRIITDKGLPTFVGAYCSDILAALSIDNEKDNYLQNMYLSNAYSNASNYIIFRDNGLVRDLNFNDQYY
jgi:hypothetical protein